MIEVLFWFFVVLVFISSYFFIYMEVWENVRLGKDPRNYGLDCWYDDKLRCNPAKLPEKNRNT
jgi:hypothetical protein